MAELLKNKIDQELFDQFCKLPILPFYKLITPDSDNLEQQKQEFLQDGKIPVFRYSKALEFDVDQYLIALNECAGDMQSIESEAWILDLYLSKLDELKTRAMLVKAIQTGNDKQVTNLAQELFGKPQCSMNKLEDELSCMHGRASSFHIHKKPIDAGIFAQMVCKTLNHYRMTNWRIKLSNKTSVSLSRGRHSKTPTVCIPKNFKASRARAKRVLIHEIEIHALRTQNGINSPLHILRIGLDRYLETDEGLAIYYQLKQGKREKEFDPGFWESYACALTQELNFKEVFDKLFKAREKLDAALRRDRTNERRKERIWNLCTRAYRGISNPNRPGLGTCKDHIYRSGLTKIRTLPLDSSSTTIHGLFAGNLGLHHIDKIKHLDLSHVKTPELINL